MSWGPGLVALGIVVVVAGLGGLATTIGPWYYGLRKPSWQPPDWLFGPAWTLIFALTAIGGVMAWNRMADGGARGLFLAAVAVNAVLNVLWSVLFFRLRRPDWALIEVVPFWLSIVALILTMWPASQTAGLMLLPYLLWVAFASWLNLTIVRLNGPFAGVNNQKLRGVNG